MKDIVKDLQCTDSNEKSIFRFIRSLLLVIWSVFFSLFIIIEENNVGVDIIIKLSTKHYYVIYGIGHHVFLVTASKA